MVMLVHLTLESSLAKICRSGINRLRKPREDFPGGVYAVPVTRNFFVSHQWLRELRRSNAGPIAGVYFRVPDGESVWVGHYRQTYRWMTAAEAAEVFTTSSDPLGWECVIPRRIEPSEIHRCRRLPQVLGWRYTPDAHGKPPFCTCKFCTRGEYGSRKLRDRLGGPDN
jgi:hypothetical protein